MQPSDPHGRASTRVTMTMPPEEDEQQIAEKQRVDLIVHGAEGELCTRSRLLRAAWQAFHELPEEDRTQRILDVDAARRGRRPGSLNKARSQAQG